MDEEEEELLEQLDNQELLERLKKDVEPNPHTLEDDSTFVDLMMLVTEEYVVQDLVADLTKEERYELAHWASYQHLAAAYDDPPLPSTPEPACMAKVALKVGRRVVISGLGAGVIINYDYPPGPIWGALTYQRPVVKLDDGGKLTYPTREEIIGVE